MLKWPLLAGAVVFHLGIALTLKIPYSNAAMLGAMVIPFGPEIMQGGLGVPPPQGVAAPGLAPTEVVAIVLVALIVAGLIWEAANTGRRLRERYSARGWDNPVRSLLWTVGIFQSYRLFDWVDERNYHLRFEVRRVISPEAARVGAEAAAADSATDRPLDPDAMFPRTMRHLLLQSYLVGNIWLRLSPGKLEAVRRSLLVRHGPPLRPGAPRSGHH